MIRRESFFICFLQDCKKSQVFCKCSMISPATITSNVFQRSIFSTLAWTAVNPLLVIRAISSSRKSTHKSVSATFLMFLWSQGWSLSSLWTRKSWSTHQRSSTFFQVHSLRIYSYRSTNCIFLDSIILYKVRN